jgi:hypothetical protein
LERLQCYTHVWLSGKLELAKEAEQAVDAQELAARSFELRLVSSRPPRIKDPMKDPGLVAVSSRKAPRGISEELLNSSSLDARPVQQSFNFGIQNSALEHWMDPIVGQGLNGLDDVAQASVRKDPQGVVTQPESTFYLIESSSGHSAGLNPTGRRFNGGDCLLKIGMLPLPKAPHIGACDLNVCGVVLCQPRILKHPEHNTSSNCCYLQDTHRAKMKRQSRSSSL